jgi:hypothetical protein
VELHIKYLFASTEVHDFVHIAVLTGENDVTDALNTNRTLGYYLSNCIYFQYVDHHLWLQHIPGDHTSTYTYVMSRAPQRGSWSALTVGIS